MVRADKMNAIDTAMFNGMIDASEQLRGDRRVRAVVVQGRAGRSALASTSTGSA